MVEIIVSVMVILISIFAQGWVLLYFTYFKKKGEYQAMKEDIDEITRTTEKIKYDLSIISQKQIGLDNEIRNSIIQYNDIVSQCVDGTLLSVFTKSTTDIVNNYFSETFAKHSLAQAKLFLFVQDDEIEQLSSQIGVQIFKIFQYNLNTMSAYEKLVKENVEPQVIVQFIQNYSKELINIAAPVMMIRKALNIKFKKHFQ